MRTIIVVKFSCYILKYFIDTYANNDIILEDYVHEQKNHKNIFSLEIGTLFQHFIFLECCVILRLRAPQLEHFHLENGNRYKKTSIISVKADIKHFNVLNTFSVTPVVGN